MPKVGNKHFPYTPEGMRQAREEALRTGKRVIITKKTKKTSSKRYR
jgi:hypothetical protein